MSEREMLPDSRICARCGKEFTVLFPDLWRYVAYKNNRKLWMCSWKCLRANETEEEKPKVTGEGVEDLANVKHRDPAEVIRQMIDAMENGEEPRAYLKRIGYANPTDQLKKLKNWAEKNDKSAAEKLKGIGMVKRGPKPEAKKPIARVIKKVEKENGLVVTAVKLPEAEEKKEEKKPEIQGFQVCRIKGPETGAIYEKDKIYGFSMKIGVQELVLPVEDWKMLLKEIPEAMRVLGVEE